MINYTSIRIIGGMPRKVIVDTYGNIINRNPTKEELKNIDKEPRKPRDTIKIVYYTEEELLNYLINFYKENGRPPTEKDFKNNPEYPHFSTYVRRFGSWTNVLRQIELDVDSMVKKGIVETSDQKARLSELKVIEHFKRNPIDLAGNNKLNPYDGICPNGKTYDVKSSKLYDGKYYRFKTRNKYRENIEIYYFLGFNENYKILQHVWRVPGEMVDGDNFYVRSEFGGHSDSVDIESMKEYEITEMIKEIFVEEK
jgi:hypothetical protein